MVEAQAMATTENNDILHALKETHFPLTSVFVKRAFHLTIFVSKALTMYLKIILQNGAPAHYTSKIAQLL